MQPLVTIRENHTQELVTYGEKSLIIVNFAHCFVNDQFDITMKRIIVEYVSENLHLIHKFDTQSFFTKMLNDILNRTPFTDIEYLKIKIRCILNRLSTVENMSDLVMVGWEEFNNRLIGCYTRT